MKRVLRWSLIGLVVIIVLAVVGLLSLDSIARSMAQKRIQNETGLTTEIGELHVGLADQTVTVKKFKMLNSAEFGGSTFIDLPELQLSCDWQALRDHHLHVRLLKLNLAQLHVIQNKDGKYNADIVPQKTSTPSNHPNPPSQNGSREKFNFDGIDEMIISIGELQFTCEPNPERSFDKKMGLKDQKFTNIKTDQQFQSVAMALALKAGVLGDLISQ